MDKAAEMVETGHRAARDYLTNPTGVSQISFAATILKYRRQERVFTVHLG